MHLNISMSLARTKRDKETKIQVNKQYIIIKIKSDLSVGQHELFLANQIAYDAEIAILAGTIGFSWALKPGISISV